MKPGATGKFPEGKTGEDDEGELTFGITCDHRNQIVRIEFGKSVAWLGMPKATALELAAAIRQKAEELD